MKKKKKTNSNWDDLVSTSIYSVLEGMCLFDYFLTSIPSFSNKTEFYLNSLQGTNTSDDLKKRNKTWILLSVVIKFFMSSFQWRQNRNIRICRSRGDCNTGGSCQILIKSVPFNRRKRKIFSERYLIYFLP